MEKTLASFGVTKAEVERWLGRPCGCRERQEKLNALGYWVRRVLSGKPARREHLLGIMGESVGPTLENGDGGRYSAVINEAKEVDGVNLVAS